METFTENWLQHNSALYFTTYLSIALSKILPHWKTIKNAKKLSVFDENDSHCLSNFLQTHTFWKFDHISRTYNQINYRNIWFPKVIRILIMTAQVLFFDIFSKKDPHLNVVECVLRSHETFCVTLLICFVLLIRCWYRSLPYTFIYFFEFSLWLFYLISKIDT